MNMLLKLLIIVLSCNVFQSEGLHAQDNIFLIGEDEVLNEGETYTIPFYLERREAARAFGFYFVSPGNEVEFIGVESPQLPDFREGSYHITDDFLSIVWIAQPPHFWDGFSVDPDLALFLVHIKANANAILHDAIAIGSQIEPELVLTSGLADTIRLRWVNDIISPTSDLTNNPTLAFYPNPIGNEIHIDGLTSPGNGFVFIYNNLGQLIGQSYVQPSMDVSMLQPGVYYIAVKQDGKHSQAVPVIKI